MRLPTALATLLALLLPALCCTTSGGAAGAADSKDLYAQFVWPPPPDPPRIRLIEILRGRADLEASSRLQKALFGAGPQGTYDWLKKPFAVAFDPQGRLLVTDPASHALFRFDRKARRVDVFGTTGALSLKTPLGLTVAPDGSIFVADAGRARVLAYDAEGRLLAAFGSEGQLLNPTGVAVAPDGASLFVADSKAHRVVVFERKSGKLRSTFGQRGEKPGEFNFPSALTFDRDGNLLVVDQINARVQILTQEGDPIDMLGGRGVGFGNLVRPKDVAVDHVGNVYVSDSLLASVQVFGPQGEYLGFIGRQAAGDRDSKSMFKAPAGLRIDNGSLRVVDRFEGLFVFQLP